MGNCFKNCVFRIKKKGKNLQIERKTMLECKEELQRQLKIIYPEGNIEIYPNIEKDNMEEKDLYISVHLDGNEKYNINKYRNLNTNYNHWDIKYIDYDKY